jgi:hypothetical protein
MVLFGWADGAVELGASCRSYSSGCGVISVKYRQGRQSLFSRGKRRLPAAPRQVLPAAPAGVGRLRRSCAGKGLRRISAVAGACARGCERLVPTFLLRHVAIRIKAQVAAAIVG